MYIELHTFNLTCFGTTLIRGTLSTLSFWGGVGQWARQWFSSFLDPFGLIPIFLEGVTGTKFGGAGFRTLGAVKWSNSIGSDRII